jgi:hypothetical protein
MRFRVAVPLLAVASLLGASPAASAATLAHALGIKTTATAASNPEAPVPVTPSIVPPKGWRLSADEVLEIAGEVPRMRRERAKYRGSYGGAYLKGSGRWQVSWFSRKGKEIGQVIISDATGRVLEAWTGPQIEWTMARGYPGAFGRDVNALYVWLPLCVLFMVPFIDRRRPWALRHLDLLALLSFSISLAFFNHGEIYKSVPLAYPPLVYLLGRMLWLVRARRLAAEGGLDLKLWIPAPWLAVGVVFLIGFRIGLNVTNSNVIDVGYAGVIGGQRIIDGKPLYRGFPSDNEHGDTYGPANYEAYVPFEQLFGWSGRWDDLPAAHAAAILFDLLAVGLLFLIGLRVRGPTMGVALSYAWVSYPFTLYALESNANDTLVAVFVLAALLAAASPLARGLFAALGGLTKFAPLALVPLLATHGLRELSGRRRARALGLFVLAFAGTAAVVSIPALLHDTPREIWERTIVYQANRGSPFSVWGLYGGMHGWETAVQITAVVLALGLAVVRRPPGIASLAAAAAAILIAVQLGVEHWFYLYIPWFFGLVMIALLGLPAGLPARPRGEVRADPRGVGPEGGGPGGATPSAAPADAASEPARSSPPAAA